MKFFHVGDLHFGKTLHDVPLIESDQPYWVEQFMHAVDEYQPDAIVIAGDVYDRRIPSPEAMKLFDHLLTELAKRDKYVFVIPGNHDSSVRLAHVNELLATHRIYIAGELKKELMHIPVSVGDTEVVFWLMPYVFPKAISNEKVLNRDDLSTYDTAVRALLDAQDMDGNKCNVLVAHQNVLANGVAPEHSESETIIGGLGEIDYSAFDRFDYVALGHIHNSQKVGRETVRYSGCPLFYDFSEIDRTKALTMVTVNSKEDIRIEQIDIPLLHRLHQETGTLEELLNAGIALKNKEQYYVQCVLQDRHVPPRAKDQLRDVYGDQLVHVKRILTDPAAGSPVFSLDGRTAAMSLEEQFDIFFQEQKDELLDSKQTELVRRIMDQQSRNGGDYILEWGSVPQADSQELLDLLMDAAAEDEE